LFYPFANLFRGKSLVQAVTELEILAVRFNNRVIVAEQVDWERPFDTDFSLLRAVRDTDPERLAALLTEADRKGFSCLSPYNFDLPDIPCLLCLGKNWNKLAGNIKVYVVADSKLVQHLSKLVLVYNLLPVLFSCN
jgi:hypothetical protein